MKNSHETLDGLPATSPQSGEMLLRISAADSQDANLLMQALAGQTWRGAAAIGNCYSAVFVWLGAAEGNTQILHNALAGRMVAVIDRAPVELLDI